MRVPAVDRRLVLAKLGLEIFEHAQIVERVDVAGDRHRHRPHMSAVGWVARHQRRVGARLVEVDNDCQALGQPEIVDFQARHKALRVECAKAGRLLLALDQVHGMAVVIDAL